MVGGRPEHFGNILNMIIYWEDSEDREGGSGNSMGSADGGWS